MPLRKTRRLAVFAACAVFAAMLIGAPVAAAASSSAVRISTLDQSRFMTAHGYYSNAYLTSHWDTPAQQWELTPAGAPDTYFVVNAGDNKCIRANGFSSVLRGTCGDAASQWRLIDHANGSVSFQSVQFGVCVDEGAPPYAIWLRGNTCDQSDSSQQFRVL